MEILIVVAVLLILAGLAFFVMRSRSGAHRGAAVPGRGGGIRGSRRAAAAARHDPMAEAVERHSAATDPHEAAEEELRLRAQANRVAADLHEQQAAALESQVGSTGHPAYGDPRPVEGGEPAYYDDDDGRPVYEEKRPRY